MLVNQWTLHVRDFGKIQQADITVSPFTMFVGRNNSGKSYLMLLLWGIINEANSIIDIVFDDDEFAELSSNISSEVLKLEDGQSFEISTETQGVLLKLFNKTLENHKEQFVRRIFNHSVSIGALQITRNEFPTMTLRLSRMDVIKESPSLEEHPLNGVQERFILTIEFFGERFSMNFKGKMKSMFTATQIALTRALSSLITNGFSKQFDPSDRFQPLYLPASRTGFMHTYRAIIGNTFESMVFTRSGYEDHDIKIDDDVSSVTVLPGTELTLPTTYFLSKLQKHNVDEEQVEKYRDELQFLNDRILKGRVRKDDKGRFRFVPNASAHTLPLHVTSSLVAELAPLSVFLESQYDPDLWIIEEIESHLHSEMQLEVTRMLFRLINKGKAVWLTTHSDNLAQQINNLLTLSSHPHKDAIRAQLGYDEADLLSNPQFARAYQFEIKDGVTVVEELELGEYGFVMKTFNDTLSRLIHETDAIQNFAAEEPTED